MRSRRYASPVRRALAGGIIERGSVFIGCSVCVRVPSRYGLTGARVASWRRQIEFTRQAAIALHPVGRGAGEALFAIAMIGTGLIAVPTLTGSTAYAFAAAVKRPSGMFKTPRQARGFYALFVGGTMIAGAIAIVVPRPMQLLVASQVVNGLLAAPLLVFVLLVANNRAILGTHTNGRLLNLLGVVTLVIMGGASLWLVGSWIAGLL